MRPGLVGIGVALLGLAVAGLVALFLIPIPTGSTTNTSSTSWTAGPGTANSSELVGPTSLHGSLTIRWQSALPLTVKIYISNGCPPGGPGCGGWQLAQSGTAQPSGNWSTSGTVRFPYLFAWSNPSSAAGTIVLTAVTTQPGSASLAPLSELVLGLAVGVLGFGGSVLLFLGLFLRGGVYRRGSPPTSARSPGGAGSDREDPAGPPRY